VKTLEKDPDTMQKGSEAHQAQQHVPQTKTRLLVSTPFEPLHNQQRVPQKLYIRLNLFYLLRILDYECSISKYWSCYQYKAFRR
jgi:hypothetical protein